MRLSGRGSGVLAAALACAMLLSSCGSVERPKITLEGVDVEGVSVDGLELVLHAKIRNPNEFEAVVSEFEYSVKVDGVRLAEGRQAKDVRIPGEGSVEVDIPSTLKWKGTKNVLESISMHGSHDWEIKGKLRVRKGPLGRNFSFKESGTFEGAVDIDVDL